MEKGTLAFFALVFAHEFITFVEEQTSYVVWWRQMAASYMTQRKTLRTDQIVFPSNKSSLYAIHEGNL